MVRNQVYKIKKNPVYRLRKIQDFKKNQTGGIKMEVKLESAR